MNTAYLELKLAWQLHSRAPEALAPDEREKLRHTARRQDALESRILQSEEAMCAMVTPAAIEERMADIRARYADGTEDFQRDLAQLGMDQAAFEEAIVRDLIIENTLEQVSSGVPAVSETEAEIFYHLHPQRFTQPETCELRHILITFQDRTERRAAYATLSRLRATLRDGDEFAAAALRYSHCPSSLDGGKLGRVRRGQLYPQIEEAAFVLVAGQLSDIVRSEVGLHLLRCESISVQHCLAFADIKSEIVQKLAAARAERAHRQWIAQLLAR